MLMRCHSGGATALIASIQPSVVLLGWRYIYIVAITSLIMIGWALIINVSPPGTTCQAITHPTRSLLALHTHIERRPETIPPLLVTRHKDVRPDARGKGEIRDRGSGGDGG